MARPPADDWDVTDDGKPRRPVRPAQGSLFGEEAGELPPHLRAALGVPPPSPKAPGPPPAPPRVEPPAPKPGLPAKDVPPAAVAPPVKAATTPPKDQDPPVAKRPPAAAPPAKATPEPQKSVPAPPPPPIKAVSPPAPVSAVTPPDPAPMKSPKEPKKKKASPAAESAPDKPKRKAKAVEPTESESAPTEDAPTPEELADKFSKGSGAANEAVMTVRTRAFAKEEVVEETLPLDEGLPPGFEPKKGKKGKKGAGGEPPGSSPRVLPDGPWRKEPVVKAIDRTAQDVFDTILKGGKPEMKSPVRSLANVKYREKVGYFELGRQSKVRTLTVNTVRTFAQSLRMMSLSKEMVAGDTFATKRDAYYQSKNWEDARFDEQTESDAVMDDIEAMFSVEGISREQLRFYPEEHGGAVAGELIVIDRDPVKGGTIEIDCTKFGSGAYTIPHSVEHLKFRTKAKFILAIETGGMFSRLQYHAYPTKANCIIVSMGGVPTRACRRFIRRLSEEMDIPVYAFVDCDPYGISNIYRSLKVGSGNAAHINRFFCVPRATFLGVTPDDITKYKLPTHPLKDVDIQRARDALKNDPFFDVHKPWARAMESLLKMGVRAEQQALAKWGLNYVMDVYLPAKLAEPKSFLP